MSVFLIKTLSMNGGGHVCGEKALGGGIQIILIMNIAFHPVEVC